MALGLQHKHPVHNVEPNQNQMAVLTLLFMAVLSLLFMADFQFSVYIYGPQSEIYTTLESIPYPKVGSANPLVSLYVFDTTAGSNTTNPLSP
ncbi:hypothetical protein EMCRGX_G023343 [Ephydatia muelleri]